MRDRYVVINEKERDEFEKFWQIPYGYGHKKVHTIFSNALNELRFYDDEDFVVEKLNPKGREIVYRWIKKNQSQYL